MQVILMGLSERFARTGMYNLLDSCKQGTPLLQPFRRGNSQVGIQKHDVYCFGTIITLKNGYLRLFDAGILLDLACR